MGKLLALMDKVETIEGVVIGTLDNSKYVITDSSVHGPCINITRRSMGIVMASIYGVTCLIDKDGTEIALNNTYLVVRYIRDKMEEKIANRNSLEVGEYDSVNNTWRPNCVTDIMLWKYTLNNKEYIRVSFELDMRIRVEGVWNPVEEVWALEPFAGLVEIEKGYLIKLEGEYTTVLGEDMSEIYVTRGSELRMLTEDIWVLRAGDRATVTTTNKITVLKDKGKREVGVYKSSSISTLSGSYLKLHNYEIGQRRNIDGISAPVFESSLELISKYDIIDIDTGKVIRINAELIDRREGIILGLMADKHEARIVTESGALEEARAKIYCHLEAEDTLGRTVKGTIYTVRYSKGVIFYKLDTEKLEILSIANQIAINDDMEQEVIDKVNEVNKIALEMSTMLIDRAFEYERRKYEKGSNQLWTNSCNVRQCKVHHE